MTDKKPPKPQSWNIPEHDPNNKTGRKGGRGEEEGASPPKSNPWTNKSNAHLETDDVYKQNRYSQDFNENHPTNRKKTSFFSPLVLIIIAIFVIGFVGFGFTTGSDQTDIGSNNGFGGTGLVYNIMWLVLIGASILAMARKNFGQTIKHALAWGFILLVGIGSVNIWMDLREQGGVKTVMGYDKNRVEIPRQRDGHYYVRAIVNGQKIRFMVDTGATDVVLNQADGKTAGFNLKKSDYRGRASTANGMVAFAPVRFDTITIGTIEIKNIRGSINGAPLGTSLLGMSYLSKLSSFEFRGDTLILNK
jgi:aspartyl protease family protein